MIERKRAAAYALVALLDGAVDVPVASPPFSDSPILVGEVLSELPLGSPHAELVDPSALPFEDKRQLFDRGVGTREPDGGTDGSDANAMPRLIASSSGEARVARDLDMDSASESTDYADDALEACSSRQRGKNQPRHFWNDAAGIPLADGESDSGSRCCAAPELRVDGGSDGDDESDSGGSVFSVSLFERKNKCLQDAVVALLCPGGSRSRARAYFDCVCDNDAGSFARGDVMERRNFHAVLAYLVASDVWLWVLDCTSDSFVDDFRI